MGDMEFNGTPEEWDALVKKNKMKTELEEAAEKYADFSNDYVPLAFGSKFNETTKRDFIEGAKWQQERMYSVEDMELASKHGEQQSYICIADGKDKKCYCTNAIHCQHKKFIPFKEWLEQFKKK